jgi:hypothetical protein
LILNGEARCTFAITGAFHFFTDQVPAYKKKKPSQEPSTPKKLLKIAGHFLASAVNFVQNIFLCIYFFSAFTTLVFLIFLVDVEKRSFWVVG